MLSPGIIQYNSAPSGPVVYLHDTFTDTDGMPLEYHTMNVGSGWIKSLNPLTGSSTDPSATIQSNKENGASFGIYQIYYAEAGVSDGTLTFDIFIPDQSYFVSGWVARYDSKDQFILGVIERDGSVPFFGIYQFSFGTPTMIYAVPFGVYPGGITVTITHSMYNDSHVVSASTGETFTTASNFLQTSTKFGTFNYNDGSNYNFSQIMDNFKLTA